MLFSFHKLQYRANLNTKNQPKAIACTPNKAMIRKLGNEVEKWSTEAWGNLSHYFYAPGAQKYGENLGQYFCDPII
jgi:hypothetical protein